MERTRLEHLSLVVLFAAISLLLLSIFAPFFGLLSLAAVFAVLLHRPYEKLVQMFRGGETVLAGIVVALTLVLVIVPLFFLGGEVVSEAHALYAGIHDNGQGYLSIVQQAIQGPVQRFAPGFTFDINAYVGSALVFISNNVGALAYQTLFIIFETSLMLIAFFFFLRDGRQLLSAFTRASPLGSETTREVLDKMYQTVKSVMKGTVVNALIRWLCVWVAFSVFNIPNAVLWSSVGGIIGAIPGLGTPFAIIPAVIYLYLAGNTLAALGLAVFGVIVIIAVDNILATYFYGKGLAVSPLFVLFSILGGIFFFGPLGFILGPLVLSIFLSVVHVYSLEARERA